MRESNLVPVIFAGGAGTRLWPLSRRAVPKPFVRLEADRTLLEETWSRARDLSDPEHVFVAVEARLAGRVRDLLPELLPDNMILEPRSRDTGPAVLNAAGHVGRRFPGSVMAMFPADHRITDRSAFRTAIGAALRTARDRGGLVCLGIPPTAPSGAFGYIVCAGGEGGHDDPRRVTRFEEKPSGARAAKLIAEGALWNSGIFLGRPEVVLEEAMRHAAEFAGPLARLLEDGDADRFFQEVPPISIDRALLERSGNLHVIRAQMGWSDLGSWDSVAHLLPVDANGNSGVGRYVALDTRGCFVHSERKPVVLIGVEGVVVIERDDVLLVAGRSRGEDLRDLREIFERRGLRELL